MKIIYLLSGPGKMEGFSDEIASVLLKDLKNKHNIAFIASSPSSYDRNDLYVYGNSDDVVGLQNHLKKVMDIKNISIIDERISSDKAKEEILNADIVYLLGGNPFTQLEYIKNNNFDDVIKKYNGIVLGTSAGAMNLSKTAYYSKDEDYPNTLFYEGISLVNVTVDPHFEINNEEQVNEAIEFSKKHDIIGLPDSSAVRIKNSIIEYIGDCYLFKNGQMVNKDSKKVK